MMQIDKSWEFLYEFYLDAPSSIAELINKALGVKSKKKVRTESWAVFFEDIISSLPKNSGDKTTYLDFLTYVKGKDDGTIDDQCTENQEFFFIDKLWSNISAKTPVSALVSKRFITTGIPRLLLPYLILYSLDIKEDWFLYGGDSESYIFDVDSKDGNKKNLRELQYVHLKNGFKRWFKRLVLLIKKLGYKLCKKKVSPEQLYPLMTLLIVLRREWELSKSEDYINLKIESLRNRNFSQEVKNDALIFELYNGYTDAEEDILKKEIKNAKVQHPKISKINIKIHHLVAKHIIESKSFLSLFDYPDIKLNKISIENGKDNIKSNYLSIEQKLGDNYSGKRLLVDYLFPKTEIRENDVFVPQNNSLLYPLADQIYLYFIKGKEYTKYWREPEDGELFDWIQLRPPINLSGEFIDTDSSIIGYRSYLKPSGEFLFVWPEENDTINEKLKKAFSDFRHDAKDLMAASNFSKDLEKRLKDTKQYIQDILKSIKDVELFLNNPTNQSLCNKAQESIKGLDDNNDIQKYFKNTAYEDEVYVILDSLETFNNTKSIESLKPLSSHTMELRRILVETLSNSLSKSIELSNLIGDKYSTLCDYIKIAGVDWDKIEKKDDVPLYDFLNDYKKHATLNAKRAELSFDCLIDKDCTIKSNEAILKVIINSIVDNAYTHGFCDTPQIIDPKIIKFVLEECGDYLLLKICNNGHPIKVTENEYKTRGVFRGPTGHTGLGGYLISKYAEQLGGYVKIPKEEEREWNTEIHLYLKK